MARERGTFNFSANLEVKKQAALDSRLVVATVAELILSATWADSDNKVWLYDGMVVSVYGDTEANNGLYMLTNKDNYANTSAWVRIDAAAAAKTTIVNGLESEATDAALSANQGKVLKGLVDGVDGRLTTAEGTIESIDGRVEVVEAAIAEGGALETRVAANESAISDLQTADTAIDGRVKDIENLIATDNNETINKVSEVITWFEGVSADGSGATLVADVAANKSALADEGWVKTEIAAAKTAGENAATAVSNEFSSWKTGDYATDKTALQGAIATAKTDANSYTDTQVAVAKTAVLGAEGYEQTVKTAYELATKAEGDAATANANAETRVEKTVFEAFQTTNNAAIEQAKNDAIAEVNALEEVVNGKVSSDDATYVKLVENVDKLEGLKSDADITAEITAAANAAQSAAIADAEGKLATAKTELEGKIKTNADAIAANGELIAANTTAIGANTKAIEANAAEIESIKTSHASDIATVNGKISANESAIASVNTALDEALVNATISGKTLSFAKDGADKAAVTVELPMASATADGLMSVAHYGKLEGIAEGAQVNVIEKVKLNGVELGVTDEKLVDLGNLQTPLSAGEGIKIENGQISTTLDISVFKVVDELPVTPEAVNENKIHVVLNEAGVAGDSYKEYMWINNAWELVGEYKIAVDLSPYLKVTDFNTAKAALEDQISAVNTVATAADTLSKANKAELGNKASDTKDSDTVYGKILANTAAIANAKAEVVGAEGDATTANTIYGAKAYADSLVEWVDVV